MSSILVSIAMCTYNGEKNIEEQISSILNQSYQNIELIIVDDISTDNTIKIIENFMKYDKRIKLFRNECNLGYVRNFAKAISLTNGKFIALSDQDDIWLINKIEILLSEIENNILIYSDAILVDEQGNNLNKNLIKNNKNFVSGNCTIPLLFNNCVSGNTVLFKRELIKYILPIPKYIEFHDHWIALIASFVGTIKYSKNPLIEYRRHPNQVTIKKESSTSINKFKIKEKRLISNTRNNLENLLYLKSIQEESSKDDILILELISHYNNFNKGFYNWKLFKLLITSYDDYFYITLKHKRKKEAFKLAMKHNFHKIIFYSV